MSFVLRNIKFKNYKVKLQFDPNKFCSQHFNT